ncbi:MAG: cysteine--tRNA ligase [Candidatus Saganbacteria bacterium]|nr:cysteine--tRNA ligase [Candidatus Saganbacteria bacterium]
MVLKVYNTLTQELEEFKPQNADQVTMYVCGITPYDETHLGHGRAYVTFDIIRRYLEFKGYKVKHVQNITDVDDKIIKKSEILNPKSETNSNIEIQNIKDRCRMVAEKYTQSYFEVMEELGVKKADVYPKATEHIGEMLKIVTELVTKGYAYELEDGIYFSVRKFDGYGKLSHRKLDDLDSGARVSVDKSKKDPLDFVLWKKSKPGEPAWESSWGPGRPGWHIECSAMSSKYLGEQFDIHGGGLDLVFPHHENEIAQSEAAFGKVPWVKYWIHNGFVNVNKEKMSKSLGNFFTLKDIFAKFNPMAVRLFLLGTHYRGPINFTDEQLKASEEALARLQNTVGDIEFYLSTHPLSPSLIKRGGIKGGELETLEERFVAAMDNDFNTAQALAVIFDLANLAHKQIQAKTGAGLKEIKELMLKLGEVLGLKLQKEEVITEEVQRLCKERDEARKNKDYESADRIKQQIIAKGYILKDTPSGTMVSAPINRLGLL